MTKAEYLVKKRDLERRNKIEKHGEVNDDLICCEKVVEVNWNFCPKCGAVVPVIGIIVARNKKEAEEMIEDLKDDKETEEYIRNKIEKFDIKIMSEIEELKEKYNTIIMSNKVSGQMPELKRSILYCM